MRQHLSQLIRVALPVPLYREFDYLPINQPHGSNKQTARSDTVILPPIGGRVQVPFGRQTLIGIVVDHIAPTSSLIPKNKLKPIKSMIDTTPLLDDSMLAYAKWLAHYYHYPLGDALSVMLPSLLRQGKPLDLLVTHWRILPNVTDADFHSNAHRQKQQFEMLKLHGEQGASEEILLLEGMNRQFLKKLEAKQLIERFTKLKSPPKPVSLAKLPLDLNPQQSSAVSEIHKSIAHQSYQGFLLNGVTGSGKTEVYLQAMQPVLEAGGQVLVLVPEIGLTPQTKARFATRYATTILLLHSALSDTERLRGWQDCREGHAQIIIGTRSAILYPFANLGLIVVDEAHDGSFKQQDTLRYHAGDVALYRGHQLHIPVVLGTATPTLEQLKLVGDGKLTELTLTKRAGNARPAKLMLIDARIQNMAQSKLPVLSEPMQQKLPSLIATNSVTETKSVTGLTQYTLSAIRQTLEAGEQVLIFLNRRGYAPILLCDACGWQADCPRCDAHLTLHHSNLKNHQPSFLKCHHCDWQASVPSRCPDCGSHNLDAKGMGTTRLSENLHAIFCNPQSSDTVYPIIQIDRDTTRRKHSWEKLYAQINTGKPAILVGTQMLAKGHHFPNVTLVCLPNADYGFLSADFRSPEHTAQLIMQVSGRAGRGDKAGRVLIQTRQPTNPLLNTLVGNGYMAFAKTLLEERKALGLPPYAYAALIRCEGKSLERTHDALKQALAILPNNQLAILGPVDAPMPKKNSRYHAQVLLLAKQRQHLHQILDSWWQEVLSLPSSKYLRLSLDVDPVGW